MSIEWTISHGTRLVLAVTKGDLQPDSVRGFLASIDAAGARPYRKIVDVSALATRFDANTIAAFAAVIREREVGSAVGPIALVAGTGLAARQARAFADRAQLRRPIRVFAEQHEARQWLDKQLDRPVDSAAVAE